MIKKDYVSPELVVSTPLVLLNVAPMAGYFVNGEGQGHGGVAGGRGDSGRGGSSLCQALISFDVEER